MDTDVFDLHVPARTSLAARGESEEAPADLGAFGWLRGRQERAMMLELRKKDGNVVALAYSWLERADFDPSVGVLLKFGVEKVKITGRNLNAEQRPGVRLFAGIVRHRVPWIQEADEPAAMGAGRGAVVEQITLK